MQSICKMQAQCAATTAQFPRIETEQTAVEMQMRCVFGRVANKDVGCWLEIFYSVLRHCRGFWLGRTQLCGPILLVFSFVCYFLSTSQYFCIDCCRECIASARAHALFILSIARHLDRWKKESLDFSTAHFDFGFWYAAIRYFRVNELNSMRPCETWELDAVRITY